MKKKFTILITAAFMLLTMMAQPGRAWGQTRTTVDDVLIASSFAATSTQYTDFSGVTFSSDAVYAGNSGKTSSGGIQLRSKNSNSGIVSTASGGTIHAVSVVVESGSNTLDIYGKNTAYSAASDLYNSSTQGTKIGSISATGTVDLTTYVDQYEYIGLRSNNGALYLTSITITWTTSGGGGSDPVITLSESGTQNIGNYAVGSEITKTFTVSQSNLSAGITLTASNGGTLTESSIVQDAGPTDVTWSFIPSAAGQFTSTITATSGETSAEFTYMGYGKTVRSVNIATDIEHGIIESDKLTAIEGEYVTLSITPADGYELGTLTITGATSGAPVEFNTSTKKFQMPDENVSINGTFEASSSTTIEDVLTYSVVGVTESSYSSWSGITSNSYAVYAGQSAGGSSTSGNCIQLRSNNNNSGIVTTASGGTAKKVVVTWNSVTDNGRTLNIYGKSAAYSAATDLYNSNNQGTLLGTIVKNTSTELTIDGDYEFIGMRSNSGAMYIDEIRITWATEAEAVAKPTFSPAAGTYPSTQNLNVTISCETEGSTIYYTTDGTDPTNTSTQYTAAIPVTETTTIKAIAYVGAKSSSIATATYTIVAPLATMQDIFDAATSTATNVYITFGDWVVSGASTSTAYVTDGTKGFVITNYSGHGFEEGDILSGTAQCSLNTNLGMARLQNFTSTAAGLTVTKGGEATIADIAMADLTAVNAGALLHYNNLLCTVEGSNYFLSDGTTTLQVYTSLWNGFTSVLSNGNYYNVTGVYHNYNTTKEICPRRAADITTQAVPSLAIEPATAQPFTYIENAGPSDDQMFEVAGTNLTSDDIVATITTGDEYFEITDDVNYSNTVTVNNGDVISVRMKAGLALGNYAGALTLTNEGAEDVVVTLSGSVTGQTYNIELDDQVEHGTIAADMTSAPAGVTVTLTATPDAGYEFGEWTVLDEDSEEVPVNNNQFEMPASDVLVSATFTAKQTYTINTVVTPDSGGTVVTLENAYEGQNVEVEVEAETGFTFSSLVVSKTDDATTTVETTGSLADGFNFTMPNYAVTVTATFISDTYTGSFVLFTGDFEEGDYILVYNGGAMNNDNTTTNNKLGKTDVTPSDNIISNPSRNIVWHIAPLTGDDAGYWTIYNAKVEQYAQGASSTNLTLVSNPSYSSGAKWYVTKGTGDDANKYDFGSKSTETANTKRYIRRLGDVFGHYASSNGGYLTLYKHTVLTPRTITFNGNGGTFGEETTYYQSVYDGIATTLDANKFEKPNSAFAGWTLIADGDVVYADGAEITVTDADLTLYAKWSTAYTAMVSDDIVGGTVKIVDGTAEGTTIIEAAENTEITLTYTANTGHAFEEWNVYKADDTTTTVTVENNKFNMPAYDVIISATFVEVTTYSLVKNVSQIVSGKHYYIVGIDNSDAFAMGGQNSTNRGAVAVTIADDRIQATENVRELVINGSANSNYTIYDVTESGFLYASSSSANQLKTKSSLDDNGRWTIAVTSDGVATITAQGTNSRKLMRFNPNNGSPLFACYATSSTTGNLPYIYIKDNDNDLEFYNDVTYENLTINENQTYTVTSGSVMEITGDLINNGNASNLIIEDGGQLITNSSVAATVKKNIVGHNPSKDGVTGYYLISSPINNMDPNAAGMITGSYDLYWFDQAQEDEEWRNYKKATFNLASGQGYLYANEENEALAFAGDIYAGDGVVTLHSQGGGTFEGWNLVGNPFTQDAYIDRPYYVMKEDGSEIVADEVSADHAIKPMQGIFVVTNTNGQEMTFSKTYVSTANNNGSLTLNVNQAVNTRGESRTNLVDRAIVRFGVNDMLPKFQLNDNSSKIYFTEGNKDYAVVSAEAQGEMPVYFKAAENGTYTLSFSMNNVEFGYLHLIDNKTGNDVDLLQTPSYTFAASTIDYASRFRLVFRAIGNENDSENNDFGFFDANGNFLILGIEGTATLQVMDVMGRVISNETFSGDYSKAINASAGVYMLRLIQGSDVRTQKVVVK